RGESMKAVLHTVIEEVASRAPDRVAVRGCDGEITYGRLDQRADAVANALRLRHGVGPGTTVALLLPPGIDYVTAMLAAWKAGGVAMPLDANTPARRRNSWIAKARPVVAIVDQEGADAWSADGQGVAPALLDGLAAQPAARLPLSVGGDDPSYVVFTSGSTGEPKGIVGVHKGLSHFIHWEVDEFGLGPDDRISQLAPPTFDVTFR